MSKSGVIIPSTLPFIPLAEKVLLPGRFLRVTLDSSDISQFLRHLRRGSTSYSSSGSTIRDPGRRLVACASFATLGSGDDQTVVSDDKNDRYDNGASNKRQDHEQRNEEKESIASTQGTIQPYKDGPVWYRMGCVAQIERIQRSITIGSGYTLILQGISRIYINKFSQREPFMTVKVTSLADPVYSRGDRQIDGLVETLQSTARELIIILKEFQYPSQDLQQLSRYIASANDEPGELADLLAGLAAVSKADKMRVLSAVQLSDRLTIVTEILTRQIQALRKAQATSTKKHREVYLRQQLNAIKDELGERDSDGDADGDSEINDLQTRLASIQLPPEAKKAADRELKRLKRTPTASAEHQVIRTYLEWLIELPWQPPTPTDDTINIDLSQARQQLDDDHHGLEQVKRRVLEHLAVMRLRRNVHGPILCLVGPPGVGKTSLGQSVARALGRKFHRVALGGVRDEAEIRGHRRTYVGAMPGLLIQGMRKCGTCDPVILLDEIDKVGNHSIHGDPSAALLEVLDPEQNHTFTDHYLNLPFDLSQCLFIATANRTDTIPPPLLDRMELIELPGYTADEKLTIARRHLMPKQAEAHGFGKEELRVSNDVLQHIIQGWTREAGVRGLEREIAAICRRAAVRRVEEGDIWRNELTPAELPEILGPERFEDEVAARVATPGLATGLAYTQTGSGGILFVECTRMPGTGKLSLTGQLGDVIKESARIAMSWLRANAHSLGLTVSPEDDLLAGSDIHIHCPAGATPKDGPSAGVTITAALYSLFSGRTAPTWLAMTGEVTLRGLVMPVGGLKEKLTAAHRAGCQRVVVPEGNRRQVLWDVPAEIRDRINIRYASTILELLAEVFGNDAVEPAKVSQNHFDIASRL